MGDYLHLEDLERQQGVRISGCAEDFNDWTLTITWDRNPSNPMQVSVEDMYQAFKVRMQRER